MKKLNFGCGTKVASGWNNIDFLSNDSRVQRVNLLAGFPFPDNHFDAVYSSHVLEHFTRAQGLALICEGRRVLKPGGILRVVLPDLEGSCREYLRVLALDDNDPKKKDMYQWIVIELLDQLVRVQASGEMGPFARDAVASGNQPLISYIRARTESKFDDSISEGRSSFSAKLKKLTPQKLMTKSVDWYLNLVGFLLPKNLRQMVMVRTTLGERHRWMYDQHGLRLLLQEAGFSDCRFFLFNQSDIPQFNEDCLDCHDDGSSYKNNSIYAEARK